MTEIRKIDIGDTHLHCVIRGSETAPPVILLHALGRDSTDWDKTAESLAADHRVVAIDFRGHGLSTHTSDYSLELLRDDVFATADALNMVLFDLVGHSLGGVVAYMVAATQPARVPHLIVEDVTPPLPSPVIVRSRPPGATRFDWNAVEAIVPQLASTAPHWWMLRNITAETLLIGGGQESHIDQRALARAARTIPAAQLMTIPVGHHVHRAQPVEFLAAVRSFLAT